MRVLVELLLGLALLSPFVEAGYWYRVTGQFYCHDALTNVKIKIIEHDPDTDDVTKFSVDSGLDFIDYDYDDVFHPNDNLELTIHATFNCYGCQGELYQYIDPTFQHHKEDKAKANPMIFGAVELSDVCKYGEAKSKYIPLDKLKLRKQWLVRDDKVNIRNRFTEIN